MSNELRDLHGALAADEWRARHSFDPDLSAASEKLLGASDDNQRASVLNAWMKSFQPCIFGKLAAERGLVSYCFINEELLDRSDQDIAAHIQAARGAWKDLAKDGRKSAFVILALSRKLMSAEPNERLLLFARRLGSLYLKKSVDADAIYLDRLKLWDLAFKTQRRWSVGVNVFAAQGDRRWWNDHRIPGGVAFSMNSVGHLVAAEARRAAVQAAAGTAGETKRSGELRAAEAGLAKLQATSVKNLEDALRFAMHTIRGASEGKSGPFLWDKATSLMRGMPGAVCPFLSIASDSRLVDMDSRTYLGWYHTDVTVPTEYFLPDQKRPSHLSEPFALDFAYLHSGKGEDYRKMAEGEVVVRDISKKGKT
jgi:hypothetical protein